MLWRIWLPIAAAAFLLTLCWLFVERRTFLTTATAAALWAYCSTTAGSLEVRSVEAGTRYAVDLPGLSYLCLGMALFSILALVLHYFEAYPPRADRIDSADY